MDVMKEEEVVVSIFYERRPSFYLYCGIIGHKEASCMLPEDHEVKRYSGELGVPLTHPADPRCWFLLEFTRQECRQHVPALAWHSTDCYRWRGGDEVNDRPVGKPQEKGTMNIAASFSLSKKPRFIEPVGKSQYSINL
jgi:hypothetical protein